jgi:GR25 family glycosyltransferase involved in LPS biosynthesis/mannosyltransferase OCH1-like enzyme
MSLNFLNFDWEKYINFYEDLKKVISSKESAINHWNNYGKYENRIYFSIDTNYDDNNDYNNFDWIKYINNYEDLKYAIFKKNNAIQHFKIYGRHENRKFLEYNSNNINILNNKLLHNLNFEYTFNMNNNIIISLTSIPTRFISNEFNNVIESLYNQLIKPKYIIINLCKTYNRNFNYNINDFNNKINLLKSKYDNLIINFVEDNGPITKILGLLNLKDKINDNDKIIVLDDDSEYINTLTYYYELVYSLYNSEAVFIDERKIINWDKPNNTFNIYNEVFNIRDDIFYDNYESFVFGWLSFSFKYKYIENLYNFYIKLIKDDINIIEHDDLILTLFYKKYGIYACGINLFFNTENRSKLDNLDPLRNLRDDLGSTFDFRLEIEKKYLTLYDIEFKDINSNIYIDTFYKDYNIELKKNINTRNILLNIKNIEYENKNNYLNRHIDIKYFNENIFILTITSFSECFNNYENVILLINNIKYELNLKINNIYSTKQTFFISTFNNLSICNHKTYDFKIIQTHNNNNITLKKNYSICTILNYIPDIEYIFFNDNDRIEFIKINYDLMINIYNKIKPGAFKADLFRILYLYKCGGIYFDCKNILFCNINSILDNKECYVRDLNDGIYNGFIYCTYKKSIEFKNYILKMSYNIFYSLYLNNYLEITGPQLFNKYINNNILLYNNVLNDEWMDSYLTNNYNNIVIKNSYNGYYNENNYKDTNHYSIMYNNKDIYKRIEIDYSKINFINGIVWINLDRSIDRKEYMEKILLNINIPSYRISGIDGKDEEYKDLFKNILYERDLTSYETACTLSHLKAINYLNNLEGDYFMVCEDDITFENIILINKDLNNIIKKCPDFDLLLINKTHHEDLLNEYSDWNYYYNNKKHIASTVCYIISRNGINKTINNAKYINDKDFILNYNIKKISCADIYLYINMNTYVYRYNFISTLNESSTIHDDHLDWHKKITDMQLDIIINSYL